MVYLVQADLAFRNAARRDAISSNIQTRLAATVPYAPVQRRDYTNNTGNPAVGLEVAFITRAEADSFWSDAITFIGTGINGPVTGSSLWRHDCPRNETQTSPCVISDERVF